MIAVTPTCQLGFTWVVRLGKASQVMPLDNYVSSESEEVGTRPIQVQTQQAGALCELALPSWTLQTASVIYKRQLYIHSCTLQPLIDILARTSTWILDSLSIQMCDVCNNKQLNLNKSSILIKYLFKKLLYLLSRKARDNNV